MSNTVNVHSRTRPTSQRGKQGRGQKQNHTQSHRSQNNYSHQLQNCNIAECSFENPRIRNHEIYENKFSNNRGHRRPERGRQTLRNYNQETTGTFKRSHSNSSYISKNEASNCNEHSENSFLPKEAIMFNNDSSRLPKHAQNPIFVGKLMQRFNSIMPSSSLLSNESQQHIQQEQITSLLEQNNKTLENPPQSFASISNNVSHGFRNICSKSPNNNCYNKSNYKTTNKGKRVGRDDHLRLSDEEVSKTVESSNISNEHCTFFSESLAISNQQSTDVNGSKPIAGLDFYKFNTKDKPRSVGQQKRSMDKNFKMPLQNVAEHLPEQIIRNNQKLKMLNKIKQPLESSVKTPTDIEKKNQIFLAHGFKGKNNGNVNISSEEHKVNSRETSLGETLVSQIKEFNLDNESVKHKDEGSKIKSSIQYSGQEQSIQQQFDLPKQVENFNNFWISQHTSEKKLPKQGYNEAANSSNIAFFTYKRQAMTDGIFAGRPHFSINQPVANSNQRVPTRSEAIQRFEEQYTVERLEHEAKERKKDAIKREQYLAKYKHVDQGHRLDDGYLDEAVGYDRGFALFDSEVDIRKRQQEKLRQDALIFQQVEKERNDQRQKKEEEVKKQRLNKQLQNMDAGYTLGYTNNPGPSQGAIPKTRSFDGYENQGRKEHRKLDDDEIRSVRLARLLPEQELPNKYKTNLAGNSQMAAKQSSFTGNVHKAKANSADTESVENLKQSNAVVEIKPTQCNENDNKESIKLQLQAKLENLISKPTKSSENEIPLVTTKPTEAFTPITPVSCILKNSSQGADGVLVLRSTPEILNQALGKKLEVIDQIDKHGESALYHPQVQPAPLYANNRFQHVADINKATGTIDKQKPQAQVLDTPDSDLTSLNSIQISSVSDQKTDQDVPSIDYLSEMKAARLRMQQKYEESLKNKQETP